ncbi:MAG TPA: hypothetical protein VJ779_18450 [Acetobacteraceae bacterium]|nr:hypothetical protein [Acetobacteraceae bacterium]
MADRHNEGLSWLAHASNAVNILTAIPTAAVMSAVGFIAALVKDMGVLTAVLVFFFIFVSALWSFIGIVWLFDQSKKARGGGLVDYAWALRVETVILNRDAGNHNAEWQVRVVLRNASSVPLRIDLIEQRLVVENVVPDTKLETSGIPFVVGPRDAMQINFPCYKRNSFPDKDRVQGQIDLIARYGYPDGPYTRIMIRRLWMNAIIKPSLFGNLVTSESAESAETLFPLGGQVHVPFGPREEDKDEPYTEPKVGGRRS